MYDRVCSHHLGEDGALPMSAEEVSGQNQNRKKKTLLTLKHIKEVSLANERMEVGHRSEWQMWFRIFGYLDLKSSKQQLTYFAPKIFLVKMER